MGSYLLKILLCFFEIPYAVTFKAQEGYYSFANVTFIKMTWHYRYYYTVVTLCLAILTFLDEISVKVAESLFLRLFLY